MSKMRVQRALAQAGVASRRTAEELIRAGQVRIDGQVAVLGAQVDPAKQRITVKGRSIAKLPLRWVMVHKPLGVVTTARDEQGRRTVFELLPEPSGLNYVGRLDVNTTGLLLLTTDGDAVHRLTHPRYRIPRRYAALVHGRPTEELATAAQQPVQIDGRRLVPSEVRMRPGRDGRSLVDLTLVEGRHHAVRKWGEAVGVKVERLARLSYGPIRLGDLPVGAWRPLTFKEETAIYAAINLPHPNRGAEMESPDKRTPRPGKKR